MIHFVLLCGRCLFLGYSDGKVLRKATRVEKFSEGFVFHNNKCDRTKHSEKLEKDVSVFRKCLRLSGRMYPSFSWEGACLYPERGLCSIRNLSLGSQRQLFPDPFSSRWFQIKERRVGENGDLSSFCQHKPRLSLSLLICESLRGDPFISRHLSNVQMD